MIIFCLHFSSIIIFWTVLGWFTNHYFLTLLDTWREMYYLCFRSNGYINLRNFLKIWIAINVINSELWSKARPQSYKNSHWQINTINWLAPWITTRSGWFLRSLAKLIIEASDQCTISWLKQQQITLVYGDMIPEYFPVSHSVYKTVIFTVFDTIYFYNILIFTTAICKWVKSEHCR